MSLPGSLSPALVQALENFTSNVRQVNNVDDFHKLCARIRQEAPAARPGTFFESVVLTYVDKLLLDRHADRRQRNIPSLIGQLRQGPWGLNVSGLVFYYGPFPLQSCSFLLNLKAAQCRNLDFVRLYEEAKEQRDLRQHGAGPSGAKRSAEWQPSDILHAARALAPPESIIAEEITNARTQIDSTHQNNVIDPLLVRRGSHDAGQDQRCDQYHVDSPSASNNCGLSNKENSHSRFTADIHMTNITLRPDRRASNDSNSGISKVLERSREIHVDNLGGQDRDNNQFEHDGGESDSDDGKTNSAASPFEKEDTDMSIERGKRTSSPDVPSPSPCPPLMSDAPLWSDSSTYLLKHPIDYSMLSGRDSQGSCCTHDAPAGVERGLDGSTRQLDNSFRSQSHPDSSSKRRRGEAQAADMESPDRKRRHVGHEKSAHRTIKPSSSTTIAVVCSSTATAQPLPPTPLSLDHPLDLDDEVQVIRTSTKHPQRTPPHSSEPNCTLAYALSSLRPQAWVSKTAILEILELFAPESWHVVVDDIVSGSKTNSKGRPYRPLASLNANKPFPNVVVPMLHDSHWTIVTIDPKNQIVECFDSCHNKETQSACLSAARTLLQGTRIQDLRCTERSVPEDFLAQSDSINCGIYCIMYAVSRMLGTALPRKIDCEVARHVFSRVVAAIDTDKNGSAVTQMPELVMQSPPMPPLSVAANTLSTPEQLRLHIKHVQSHLRSYCHEMSGHHQKVNLWHQTVGVMIQVITRARHHFPALDQATVDYRNKLLQVQAVPGSSTEFRAHLSKECERVNDEHRKRLILPAVAEHVSKLREHVAADEGDCLRKLDEIKRAMATTVAG